MFKDTLRLLRKDAGLTQGQLAKALNVSTSTIGMYERGDRMPPPDMLISIAEYFHTDVNSLLGVSADKPGTAHCCSSFTVPKKTEKEILIESISSKLVSLSEEDIKAVYSYAKFLQQKD